MLSFSVPAPRPMRHLSFYFGIFLASSAMAVSFEETLDYTLDHAPNIEISVANRTIAQSQMSAKAGAFLPVIDANLDLVHDNFSQDGANQDRDTDYWRKDYQLVISQNIFDGLQRYHQYRTSERQLLSQIYATQNETYRVLVDAASSYVQVLLAQELVILAKDNFKRLKDIADLIDKRVQQGLSREIDRVQAQGRLASARANVITALADYHKQQSLFKRQTGGLDALDLTPVDLKPLAQSSFESYWERVQNYALNVKQSAYQKEAAYYQYQTTKAAFFPQVNAVARFQYRQNIDGYTDKYKDSQIGVNLSYNLFRGNQDFQTMYSQAQVYQQAVSQLRQQKNQLEYLAVSTWEDYQNALNTLTYHQEHEHASAAVTQAYRDQFVLAQRSLLDLLDAYNEWYRSLNALARQRAVLQMSLIEMGALNGELRSYLHNENSAKIFLPADKERRMASHFLMVDTVDIPKFDQE